MVHREVATLSRLQHQHVVRYYQVIASSFPALLFACFYRNFCYKFLLVFLVAIHLLLFCFCNDFWGLLLFQEADVPFLVFKPQLHITYLGDSSQILKSLFLQESAFFAFFLIYKFVIFVSTSRPGLKQEVLVLMVILLGVQGLQPAPVSALKVQAQQMI